MKIISAREFRTQQGKYFDLITTGEDVIVKSRAYGSFKITPVTEDDTIMSKEEFLLQVKKSQEQIKNGESYSLNTKEELETFLDNL